MKQVVDDWPRKFHRLRFWVKPLVKDWGIGGLGTSAASKSPGNERIVVNSVKTMAHINFLYCDPYCSCELGNQASECSPYCLCYSLPEL